MTFTEIEQLGLGSTDGLAWADYDNDGDLDIASGNEHSPTQNYLYINELNDPNYLHLHLIGHYHDLGSAFSNRDGVGAKVSVYEYGFLNDIDHLLAYRKIEAHGGFSSQNMIEAAFGLPGHEIVDVSIFWPGTDYASIQQDIIEIAVGQKMIIHEDGESIVRWTLSPTPAPR